MFERLSLSDDSLLAGYAESIQRVEFSLPWCKGQRVLDAGCGSGYGAHYLAANGAAEVVAIDVSDDAIAEAKRQYARPNLRFETRDLEQLDARSFDCPFNVVVNLETLPHLAAPDNFLAGATAAMSADGVFICSIPNGELVKTDEHGKPLYRYQHRTYSADQFKAILAAHFGTINLFGHWLTHEGMLRRRRAREVFDQLTEAYFNPMARIGRAIKRLAGKASLPPPAYTGAADSYRGDYAIAPLAQGRFGWAPTTLIAVCTK